MTSLLCNRVQLLTACLVGSLVCCAHEVRAETLKFVHTVAFSGDASPDQTGELLVPLRPIVQDGNRPVFVSDIRKDGLLAGNGIFRAGPLADSLVLLARAGTRMPDDNGNLHAINDPAIQLNNQNAIAFFIQVDGSLGGVLDDAAILFDDGAGGGLEIVARKNQLAPNSIATFTSMPKLITLNDAGQVSFRSLLSDGLEGIFRGNTASDDVTVIAIEGEAVPVGSGTYRRFKSQLSMNESGQVAFHADVLNDATNLSAIYVGNGTTTTEIVRRDEATPSNDGEYDLSPTIYIPINDSGQVAFFSTLSNTTAGVVDNEAIYLGNGTTTDEIARKGDLVPGDNGRYLNFERLVGINNPGQVLFLSTITGASDGASEGIFLGTSSEVKQVARVNQVAPGGGRFAGFNSGPAVNNEGEVAFFAWVDLEDGGLTNDVKGLFLSDGEGLSSIARVGDLIPGTGEISDLYFDYNALSINAESGPLNDHGELTFRFTSGVGIGVALYVQPLFADSFE